MRRLALALLLVPLAAPAAHAGGDPGDSVTILSPEHGAYYPDVPVALTVTVEVVHNSALVIQEVTLRVDDVEQPHQCEGAGTCEFEVELPEGVHSLRAFAARNIGVALFSNIVEVQVGGDPPAMPEGSSGDEAGESSGGAIPHSTGSDDGGGGESSEGGGDTGQVRPSEGGDDGCGCRQAGPARAWLLAPLVALAVRRRGRARACARPV